MQFAYDLIDTKHYGAKLPDTKGFRITSRELEVLRFVLDMKFSTVCDIHEKFFKVTKAGNESSCLRWARERIAILVKYSLLAAVKDVCHRTLYTVTTRGYLFLKNSYSKNIVSRPISSVDGRTYDHDQKVIQIRLAMEKAGLVKDWISERQLSEIEEYRKYLPTEFRPDAIYITPKGQKIAFELEIARKAKERYRTKVNRYIQILSEPADTQIFNQVHYACEKSSVLHLIQDQTQLFQDYFKFNLTTEIIN